MHQLLIKLPYNNNNPSKIAKYSSAGKNPDISGKPTFCSQTV